MKTTFKIAGTLEIHRVAYGAMQLTGEGVFGDAKDRATAVKLLQTAVELGVDFIDTADAYGPHTNETLIADALAPYKKVVVATKGGLQRPAPGQWSVNGDPKHIREAIEGSLKRLKLEAIDLWQLHRIDGGFPVEETLRPVADAVKAGKIKHVGLSDVSVKQIEQARKVVPIVSVQNLYNLENRQSEEVLEYTIKNDMAFIPWFPLATGPEGFSKKVQEVAKAHGATTAQIALAWLLKRADNILLIPGTSTIAHLRENVAAVKIELTDAEFKKLAD
jgi:aryl-alcohol dehydrogenase-like predicted oxidoreductase